MQAKHQCTAKKKKRKPADPKCLLRCDIMILHCRRNYRLFGLPTVPSSVFQEESKSQVTISIFSQKQSYAGLLGALCALTVEIEARARLVNPLSLLLGSPRFSLPTSFLSRS